MKTQKQSFLIISTLALIVYACGNGGNRQGAKVDSAREVEQNEQATPDVADVSFKDGMTGKVFHNYLQLKMALTESDPEGASTAASNLAETFGDERAELKETAEKITQTNDLEEQRRLFSGFTQVVTPLIEENLESGSIYQKFCPMAFNNEGAYWLSDIEPVNNPYFGEKMLRCGRIERTIEK